MNLRLEYLQVIYGDAQDVLRGQLERYQELLERHRALYGEQEVIIARAPGRVDLLGSHTDYHQGCVLTMALDRDTVMIAGRRDDAQVKLRSTNPRFAMKEFRLDSSIPVSERGSWDNYVKAAAQAFVQVYGLDRISGANILIDGHSPFTVPLAAGLSSSSALVVCSATAFAGLNRIEMTPKQFARFCGEAEWYVGTRGGFMDHFTSVLNQKGTALFLDCRPVTVEGASTFLTEQIRIPAGYSVAIFDTKVKKEKSASSDYNIRALETRIGLELLRAAFPQATHLRDIPPDAPLAEWLPVAASLQTLAPRIPAETLTKMFQDHHAPKSQALKILPRCQHVIAENARVLRGCELLKSGDMAAFGEVMHASYRSMKGAFEGSCAELDALMESAQDAPGLCGIRIAGAGWGGCAVAAVRTSDAQAFCKHVAAEYWRRTGLTPDVFLCQPGQGAGIVSRG